MMVLRLVAGVAGEQGGFETVVGILDNMVTLLKEEQASDEGGEQRVEQRQRRQEGRP